MRLKDKVAVITGAANGIGKATAFAFNREGAIVIIANIDEAWAKETASAIVKSGDTALAITTDEISPTATLLTEW